MARRAQVVLGLVVLVVFALGSSPSQGAPSAKPPDFDKAAAAVEKHADKWLDKPGVVGVGVGVNRAGKAVVHVYKLKDAAEDIPSDVDGVAVEQIQSGRFDPRALPTDRWPHPVPIGVSSGLAGVATGTLGARVTDGTHTYALSNNHVYAGVNTASTGDSIIQPGDADGGSDPADRIGTLADYQQIDFSGGNNLMDAAIALTTADDVGTATPPDGYGAPSTIPTAATIGMGVQKYGRTTGFRQGTVQDVNFAVDVCYFALSEDFCFPGFEARFVNQIAVSPGTFSAPGDSGSLMVTQGGNQPVALLFAGDGTLTIGNPIVPVLQRFGVTIEGQPPGDGPPGAPTGLNALAGAGSVALSWNAPAFDGGSPISNYRVYRGTSPGAVGFHANAGTTTSYADTSGSNGTTYYYKVSAENGNGEGPLSNEANATPTDLVAPAAPLVALDTFNRANESPLSDAGKWSNNMNGGVENGLNVNANQLACAATTTCTAWRNNAQYGPDAESWARVSTLPGTGNAIRLYARVQSPGTAAYDGYMLLVSQQAATDQATIYRITNSGLTALVTAPQELAVGDTVLLRAKGSTLEAWRHDGSAWSRFGLVQDATYAGAGFSGVGIRGTTGRLDDFGARTVGDPPPDTEDPSAPGTLTASPFSSSQIELTWGPATDNVGVTHYQVERCSGAGCSNFAQIALSTSSPRMDVFLDASTSYSYRVRAVDAAGNAGPYSNTASATTPAPPDTEPPTAPTGLNASATSPTQIDLTWTAATDNVAVTLYHVERCSGASCSSFAEIGTTASTTFPNTGLTPSTSYSYRVRAQDAVPNFGDYSATASATTPTDVVPPVEPLAILDTFNRRNENPLSDAGRWSNGVIGSVETGLRVSSNALECTKTTTCTAWRNNATYGPDIEVYARIATLPGANNGFRVYARLQGVGTSAQSGYLLRTNQLTGTDQVFLERIGGGTIVTRLTMSQELAAGDTLLLRVKGSKLEAWLKRGSTWSLLGSVVDSTYSAAGRVGVGIRGKTGRLDDFGAR